MKTEGATIQSGPGMLRSGLARRFAAIFYDAVLLIGILVLASLIVVAPLRITYGHPWYPLYVIYVYSVAFVFFGWFWTHGGQTLGMKTWGIRIVAMDGRPHGTVRRWQGDSIGHWEQHTLVVDTVNFTDKTAFRGSTANPPRSGP